MRVTINVSPAALIVGALAGIAVAALRRRGDDEPHGSGSGAMSQVEGTPPRVLDDETFWKETPTPMARSIIGFRKEEQ